MKHIVQFSGGVGSKYGSLSCDPAISLKKILFYFIMM